MSRDRAVLFVTDRGFVVPTVAAALQVVDQLRADPIADVYIVITGLENVEADIIRDVGEANGIRVISAPAVEVNEGVNFNKTHVPPSTLGRFSAVDLLPSEVKHVVYLDGDIQIVGDLMPLLRYSVAPGKVLAANDKRWLGSFGRWKSQRKYLRGLGVSANEYFNAGVLAFRRETWADNAPKALQFFMENSDLCQYHDQSALNVVFKGRREHLHPRYDFISDYDHFDAAELMDPVIIHFTGGLKPWFYSGPPWGRRFFDQYQKLVAKYPSLKPFLVAKTEKEQYWLTHFSKRQTLRNRTYFPFLPILKKWRTRRYLAKTKFAVR